MKKNDRADENGFDRADRKVGQIYSRLICVFPVTAALIVFVNSINAENFSIVGYWPAWLFVGAMMLITIRLWKSKAGMLSILSN